MCKMTAVDSKLFLSELQRRNFTFQIDRNKKLHILRKLPAEIADQLPQERIPASVNRIWVDYKAGRISKEALGAPKYHDRIKVLRRYNLIPQLERKTLTPEEKRASGREYLRQWRKAHSKN